MRSLCSASWLAVRHRRLALGFAVLLALGQGTAVAGDDGVSYAGRWRTAEAEPLSIAPPLELLWQASPAWFPRWNRGGPGESDARRIANTPYGLVTLINRTFYMLDRDTGSTLWSLGLEGDLGVSDWKVADGLLFYAARDWDLNDRKDVRSAIDIEQHQTLWTNLLTERKRFAGGGSLEWLIPVPGERVLYSTQYETHLFAAPIDVLDARTGELLARMDKEFGAFEDVFLSWFVFGERLHVFLHPRTGGIALKSYDLSTYAPLDPVHLYGGRQVRNWFAFSVDGQGRVFVAYEPARSASTLVAYDLPAKQALWVLPLTAIHEAQIGSLSGVRQIVVSPDQPTMLVATVSPNWFVVVDAAAGSIVRMGRIPGYDKWHDFSPVLYSHPYLLAGAIRGGRSREISDLVALNVDSGKVEWSYELGRHDHLAHIVNFVMADGKVFLSLMTGQVLAFTTGREEP